jgi:hypothetical protein
MVIDNFLDTILSLDLAGLEADHHSFSFMIEARCILPILDVIGKEKHRYGVKILTPINGLDCETVDALSSIGKFAKERIVGPTFKQLDAYHHRAGTSSNVR